MGVVYRCLGDQGSSEGGMVTSEEGDGGGGTSGGVATNQTYVFNSMLPYKEDETHAFRLAVSALSNVDQMYQLINVVLQRCWQCQGHITGVPTALHLCYDQLRSVKTYISRQCDTRSCDVM